MSPLDVYITCYNDISLFSNIDFHGLVMLTVKKRLDITACYMTTFSYNFPLGICFPYFPFPLSTFWGQPKQEQKLMFEEKHSLEKHTWRSGITHTTHTHTSQHADSTAPPCTAHVLCSVSLEFWLFSASLFSAQQDESTFSTPKQIIAFFPSKFWDILIGDCFFG